MRKLCKNKTKTKEQSKGKNNKTEIGESTKYNNKKMNLLKRFLKIKILKKNNVTN